MARTTEDKNTGAAAAAAAAASSPTALSASPRPPLHGQQQPLSSPPSVPLPPHVLKKIEKPSKMADRKISWDIQEEEDHPSGVGGTEEPGDGVGYARGQKKGRNSNNPQPVGYTTLKNPSYDKDEEEQGSGVPEPDGTIKKPQGRHKRQISWGGTTIEIPQAFEEHFSIDTDSSVLSHPPNDDRSDRSVTLEDEERYRLASEAVAAAEAAIFSKSPRGSQSFSLHHRFGSSMSSTFRVQLEDLAKTYPVESEAETHILKAIEATESKREARETNADGGNGDNNGQGDEGIAKLFTPVTQNLLGNVPEGSEGIFHRAPSQAPSSVTGNSNSGGGSTTESRRKTWHHRGVSIGGAYSGASKGSGNTSSSPSSRSNFLERATMSRAKTTGTASYGRHQRQKTMEEHLYNLNQAFDTVDQQAATALDFPLPALGNLPARRTTTDEFDPSENVSPRGRGRSTSLDLFNESMARLFQDVGINDTRVIPSSEEMLPLAENDNEDEVTPNTWDDNPIDRNESNRLFVSNSEAGKDNDGLSQLDGEKIPYVSEFASGDFATHVEQESSDIESGRKTSLQIKENTETCSEKKNSSHISLDGKRKRKPLLYRFFRKLGVVQNVDDFLKPRRPSMWKFLRALLWLVLPAIGISAILFYEAENPPTGVVDLEAPKALNGTSYVTTKGRTIDPFAHASHSWWILYACVRLPITFALARFFQVFFIDFLILERRCIVGCMGPTFTLLLVQAKGWPALLFFWSVCNLGLLYGDSPFAAHWGYWQDYVDLFNSANPSGSLIASSFNLRLQLCALGASVVVAFKRLLVGFYQGRKTYLTYAEDLTNVMTKILLVSEVANLAVRLENEMAEHEDEGRHKNTSNLNQRASTAGIDDVAKKINQDLEEEEKDGESSSHYTPSHLSHPSQPSKETKAKKLVISEKDKSYATGRLSEAQRRRIERLLGNWEEPEKDAIMTDNVSIGAILQFRTSLAKLDTPFPFSYAFGKAYRRDQCIESSQDLFLRLLDATPDRSLHFNTLGLVALQRDNSLDQEKLKSLIKVFRPGRNGSLSLVEFVKSVDAVYKEMKLLRASVRSSQKIDHSFEYIFNTLFYALIAIIVMVILGLDPLALFVSVSTFVLAFSFMISRASSNYFEGLLFILCRRPYDIGDRIVIQNCEAETSAQGSTDWIVRDIDLFTTTVLYAYTNEIATLSNGSIANSRVMNGSRSLPALLYVHMRFGIDVTAEQMDVFREALYQWVLSRPREWSKLWDVRNLAISADQGFVEYMIILEHVENWQNLDALLFSRGQARKFCHELSKQLDMRYKSPPLPVDLHLNSENAVTSFGREKSGDAASYMAERQELIRTLIQGSK